MKNTLKIYRRVLAPALLSLVLLIAGAVPGHGLTDIAPAAPGAPATFEGDGGLIGVVLPTSAESRWPVVLKLFKQADPDIQVLYSDDNPTTEKENVKTLADGGCKVIVICSVDPPNAAAEADYAKAHGAVVICYERMITGTGSVDYFVSFDNTDVGYQQGEYLVNMAQGKGKGLNLYLYNGGENDDSALVFLPGIWKAIQPKLADGTFIVRNSPMANALKDKPALTPEELMSVAYPTYTGWVADTAGRIAMANLALAPESAKGTVFVLAPNDDTSAAITDVFRADPDVHTIYSTGQEFTENAVQYIIDGKQSMTVAKFDKYLIQDTMGIANQLFAGQDPASAGVFNGVYDNGTVKVPEIVEKGEVVTLGNVKDMILQSGMYSLSQFKNLN